MDPRTAIVIAELDRRFAKAWTVSELASLAGVSASRFARIFRADVGTTPMRYLRCLRLSRAAVLLTRTALPLETVIATVGYRDRRHFRRDFVSQYGMAPAAWRRRHRAVPVDDAGGQNCRRVV